MIHVQQLRQKAQLLRRVASIPTHGDGLIDRDLLVLAHQLEEAADVREEYLKTHGMPEDGSSYRQPGTVEGLQRRDGR